MAATLAAWAASAGDPRTLPTLMQDASNFRHWNQPDNSMKAIRAILEHPQATDANKAEAYSIMIDVHWRTNKRDETPRLASELLSLLPESLDAARVAHFWWADWLRESRRHVEALVKLREYLARAAADKPGTADARLRMAEVLRRMGKHAEAALEAQASAAAVPGDDKRVSDALRYLVDSTWDNGDMEGCVAAVARVLEERYLRHRNAWEQASYRHRNAEALDRLERYDEAREAFYDLAATDGDLRRRQAWALRAAQTFTRERRWADAAAAFERVIVDHPGCTDRWDEAQRGLAEMLRAAGDAKGALRAARVGLDAAWDHGQVNWHVRRVADFLAAADGDVTRANAFLDYQRHGPAGPDGKPGTADDLKDPLVGVGYPDSPGRAKAFAKARAEAGDGWEASRLRALSYTYVGQPKKALAYFVDAFGRSPERDIRRVANEMVCIGVRAARGHPAGLEDVYHFVALGPAGPDGKPGTADDVPDPIAPLLVKVRPEAGAVDLAGHSEGDLGVLREARGFLEEFAQDPHEHPEHRRNALWSLVRIHEALGDWGSKGVREWFMARTPLEGDDQAQAACVAGAQTASRAGAYHLGALAGFWGELDGLMKREGKGYTGQSNDVLRRCQDAVKSFAEARDFAPRHGHLRPEEARRDFQPGVPGPWKHEPRKPDVTPPGALAGLELKGDAYRSAELAWRPAEDAESGVAFYSVLRDGKALVEVTEPAFTDDGLDENARYVYEVSAVNGIGMASERRRLVVETEVDRKPPRIAGVLAAGDRKLILVTFTEPVAQAGAEDAASYRLSHDVRVTKASLSEDGRVATLAVSGLEEGPTYTLTISGIRDTSDAANVAAPRTRRRFVYVDTGDGLLGTYYDERDFQGRTRERVDPQVNFRWNDNQDTGTGIRANQFNIRWTGKVRVEKTGTWAFIARTDDGVRVWVDGRQIIDDWRDRGATDSVGRIDLEAGRRYDIRVDYFQGGGETSAELFWQGPETPRELVPKGNLYSR